ncbi:MAG: AEC family transporter [Bauldia sp.]|nr:AEC family transporter [Bauldia sp.]
MSEIATIILPFFGLIALGYGAGRYLGIPPEGTAGLHVFIFYFALPALFFQLVAETPLSALANWSFVLTTTFSTYCAFAIAFSFGALVNRGNIPEATIQGLVGSYANIGYMAPGLTLAAFGSAAAAPTALIFSFDNAMLFTLVPLMMALGGSERATGAALARVIGRQVLLHPFILATLAGFLAAAVGLKPPGPIDGILTFLRSAAAPCALFALGVTLAQKPVGKVPFDLPVLIAIKLVVHPLIVYLLLTWIGGFDRVWIYSAVLMAALPPAANVYVLAQRYDSYVARASAGILLGTLASIVTVTVVLSFLIGDGAPAGVN